MTAYPEKLLQLLSESVLEQCASAGFPQALELDPRDQARNASDTAMLFAASLGFSGDAMKGALVVLAPAELLAASNPQRDFVKDFLESDHADWIGEIANQIVGGLKRRVAGYHVDFQLSTPTVVRGAGLMMAKAAKAVTPTVLWFDLGGLRLQIEFTATLGADVSFDGDAEVTGQAASGDALLF